MRSCKSCIHCDICAIKMFGNDSVITCNSYLDANSIKKNSEGKWQTDKQVHNGLIINCSVCDNKHKIHGVTNIHQVVLPAYCFNCGAKMTVEAAPTIKYIKYTKQPKLKSTVYVKLNKDVGKFYSATFLGYGVYSKNPNQFSYCVMITNEKGRSIVDWFTEVYYREK